MLILILLTTDILGGGRRSFSERFQLSPSFALLPGVLGVSDPISII